MWNISDASLGTEELAHLEMIGAIVYQLTKDMSLEDIKKSGFDSYFVDHTAGIYPSSAAGVPYSTMAMAVKGDPITDLHEDLAAEQKARTTYDNILRFCDDPDVKDAIRFLRQREVVHYQRFGEGLRRTLDRLDDRNFYIMNPSFDKIKPANKMSCNSMNVKGSNMMNGTMSNEANNSAESRTPNSNTNAQ